MLSEDQRDEARKRAHRRAHCKRCGNPHVEHVDGSKCGGLPGIVYKYCGGCGYGEATKRKPESGTR
jgi:late competence protein required for DNA uptake (superfamily II DNA/RNA helicase)